MRLQFQTRWLRVWVEILPRLREIRRYRVVPPSLEGPTGRMMHRRIAWKLRRLTGEDPA